MIEKEGICDDCGGAMEDKGNNIWYCPHCELYLEWHPTAWYYVCLSDKEAFEKMEIKRMDENDQY